jgi:hypothetical protein
MQQENPPPLLYIYINTFVCLAIPSLQRRLTTGLERIPLKQLWHCILLRCIYQANMTLRLATLQKYALIKHCVSFSSINFVKAFISA